MPLDSRSRGIHQGAIRRRRENDDPPRSASSPTTRATTFLIGDGVIPSNEGRGYVLRKIMRRGSAPCPHARRSQPLSVADGCRRPHRNEGRVSRTRRARRPRHIQKVVAEEEHRFQRTVEVGLSKLDEDLKELRAKETNSKASQNRREIRRDIEKDQLNHWRAFAVYSGQNAFRLYDTFGLPRDFIEDVTRDAGVKIDWSGFDRAMQEQRTRAKASWRGGSKEVANPAYSKLAQTFKTEPDFYFGTKTHDARIEAIVTKDGAVNEIKKGQEAEIVLDRTSIYSESGGQVADTGGFFDDSASLAVAEVKRRVLSRQRTHRASHRRKGRSAPA